MFETLASSILQSLLGQYIKPESFSPSSIETSLSTGNLRLSNLQLKTDSFDWLLLPLKLSCGFVGQVEISIPWTTALSDQSKVLVEVDKVLLVFATKTDWSPDEREQRAHLNKLSRLAKAELVKRSREAVAGGGHGRDSEDTTNFSARFAARLLSKLEVLIKHVSIRIESPSSSSSGNNNHCGFGLCLSSFKVVNAEDAALDPNDTCKLCALSDFSLFLSPQCASLDTREEIVYSLATLEAALDAASRQELLRPTDASLRIITKASGDLLMALDCTNVELVMDQLQHASLLWLTAMLQETPRIARLSRPKSSALVDPRSWWKVGVPGACWEC